jgi:hypothetical protein
MRVRFISLCLVLAAAVASPAAASPGFFVGAGEDDPAIVPSIAAPMQDLGMTAIRLPLWWKPGQTSVDAEQQLALSRMVAETPASVRIVLSAGGFETPLVDATRTAYCTWLRDIIQRYPRINDLIVWNEPNKTDYWRPQFNLDGSSASPAGYVALLARCWDLLHAYRPTVNVIAPSTSPRGNDNPNAVSNISHSPLRFIRRMGEAYRASGRTERIFDTAAHHAYGSTPGERPWRTHSGNQLSQGDYTKLMNQFIYAFQGTNQPIPGECKPAPCVWLWYTEAGYQTTPDAAKAALYSGTESVPVIPDYVGGEPASPPPGAGSVAPDHWTQLVDGIRLAACQPYVQAFFNYLVVDQADLGRWQSGLLWADRTPKDSYEAFKQAAAEARAGTVDCNALKQGPYPAGDRTPPGRPAAPRAVAGPHRVSLDWADAPEDDVMGFHVFRGARATGPFVRLTAEPVAGSAYVDRSAANRRSYHYVVSAVDTMGNQSARSQPRCATPRLARESYGPARIAVGAGRVRGSRAPGLLAADDGRRLSVAASRRSGRYVAELVATVRMPTCHGAVRALGAAAQAAATARGLAVTLAVRTRGGWRTLDVARSAAGDRSLVGSTRTATRWISRGAVRIRLRATGARPFTARLDLARVTARY